MICVETANAADDAVTLPAGGRHLMSATLRAGSAGVKRPARDRRVRARRLTLAGAAPARRPPAPTELEAARAAQAEAARRYRESLEALLPLQEARWSAPRPTWPPGTRLVAQGLVAAAGPRRGRARGAASPPRRPRARGLAWPRRRRW